MKQILHIFAKDTRRFWPEILISLAITTVFIRVYPTVWLPTNDSGLSMSAVHAGLQRLASAMVVLVPLSWWLLIARVIHAERLVGSTQWWLTRPYEGMKLLAAKLLFLLAFLYLPFFIAQCLLLVEAGFHPLDWLPGLLYNLLLITAYFVLPLIALAAVTSSFARMTLTLLGIFLGLACLLALVLFVPMEGFSSPYRDLISFALFLILCTAAIAVQYATRKVWLARTLLIAIPVQFFVIGVTIPDRGWINRTYPPPAGAAGTHVQLEYRPDPHIAFGAYSVPGGNRVGIAVPIQASGMAEGDLLILENVKAAIQAPDGSSWTSDWQPVYRFNHLPVDKNVTADFRIPRAVYDRYKAMPLSVHLTYASTMASAVKVTAMSLPTHEVSVPDIGICSTTLLPMASTRMHVEIDCRSAVREHPLTHGAVNWSNPLCGPPPTDPSQSTVDIGWRGAIDSAPAQFGISPVITEAFLFENSYQDLRPVKEPAMCPGSTVTFAQYKLVGRTQTSLNLQDFRLPAMRRAEVRIEQGF
jgi:hypothetical protein